jgi:hypothetical protein
MSGSIVYARSKKELMHTKSIYFNNSGWIETVFDEASIYFLMLRVLSDFENKDNAK